MTVSSRALDTDGIADPWRRLAAIASVSAGSVLYTLDGGVANVALPTIARNLGIPAASAVLLVSAYNLVLAMTLLPLAAVGDRIGHRKVFGVGFAIYLVAALGCLFTSSFWILIGFRAVQALAAASLLSVSLGLVRAIYPLRMLGRGMGLNTMVASGGAALAPVLGGAIVSALSWQWVFAAGLPFALIGLLATRALPQPERTTKPYDGLGALLCAVTFGLLIFGFQALSEGASRVVSLGCIGLGVLVAVFFVRHERRIELPVLPVDLLAQPVLALTVAGALFGVLGSTALLLFLPFQLSAHGFDAAMIGAMIAPYALLVLVLAPTSGMLSDRISPQVLGLTGLVLSTVAAFSFYGLEARPAYLDVAWRTGLFGAGFALFFSPNARLMIASAPRARVAGASSLLSTTRMFGQALGSALLGGLLSLGTEGNGPILAIAGLVFMALVCAALRMVVPDPAAE